MLRLMVRSTLFRIFDHEKVGVGVEYAVRGRLTRSNAKWLSFGKSDVKFEAIDKSCEHVSNHFDHIGSLHLQICSIQSLYPGGWSHFCPYEAQKCQKNESSPISLLRPFPSSLSSTYAYNGAKHSLSSLLS